jgi:hypothetical protein
MSHGSFLRGMYSADELRMLVTWRQYFDVTYLSEISDAAGTHLLKTVWEGILPHRTVDRPTRARHPPRRNLDVPLWRQALSPFIISSRNRRLIQPLRPWLSPPAALWRYQYSPSEDCLFEQSGHIWTSYVRTS